MKKLLLLVSFILLVCLFSFCSENSRDNEITIFRWDFDISGSDDLSKKIETETGVKIKTISVPWTGWSDKLNTMVASDSAPDMFVGYGIMDIPSYNKWIKDSVLLPISDYVNESNYPNINEYLKKWDSQRINGKIYSLPVESYVDHVVFVRSDWLEECGLTPPETIQEFYNVLVAFKNKYNIYPFNSSAPHTAGLFWMNMFFYAFGSSWNDWDELPDGSYIPSWISDGAKEATRFMKKLYDEKLLDPDFVTNSDDVKKEKFYTNKLGIMAHGEYDLIKNTMDEVNPSAQFITLPPVKGDYGQAMWGLNGYFSAVMINTKLNKNKINNILKLLDYIYSDKGNELLTYGIENVHYKMENGKKLPLLPLNDETNSFRSLIEVSPIAKLKFLRALEWKWMPEWSKNYNEMTRIIDIGMKYSKPEKFPYIITETKSEIGQQLQDFINRQYIFLITQSKDFDNDWDSFVKEYRNMGGDKLIKEMNDKIK